MTHQLHFLVFKFLKKKNYMKNLIKFLLKPLNPVDLEFVHATKESI